MDTASENFRNIPQASEGFGSVPHPSEKREGRTLTVREVARMFEKAGVAKTERSIVNWCRANKQGATRLDCYLDPNEGKYFITPLSAERAIKEEQARVGANKMKGASQDQTSVSEGFGNFPKASKENPTPDNEADASQQIKKLNQQIFDLTITNTGKDYFIEQLKGEREEFIKQLTGQSKRIGELETRLLQPGAPEGRDVL